MIDRLTPRIVELQNDSRLPLTVYIDSPGGSTLHTEKLLQLLRAPSPERDPACRILSVVTGEAASAAADLLCFADYSIAYPGATIFLHGVRYFLDDPLTVEAAATFTGSLRSDNSQFAMKLADHSVHRFIFRYLIDDLGSESDPGPPLDGFLGRLATHLSADAAATLDHARERYRRYEWLAERVMKRAARSRKFQRPTRQADSEEVLLREVIAAVAHRNGDRRWTFHREGINELTDDFLLLWQYLSCYDHGRLRAECLRWAPFLLEDVRPEELAENGVGQEEAIERLKPILRPVWLFFVALCHTLQQGEENRLTATDACRLGLVDEVLGSPELPSLRLLVERSPD